MLFRILLAEPDSATATVAATALVKAGYRVASVGTFEEATQQVALNCPDLLVAGVRLGAYNGVHLMHRARADHHDMPVIFVGISSDYTNDMAQAGTRFAAKPIDPAAFVVLVSDLLKNRKPVDPLSARQWPRKRTTLPAVVETDPARVVELSYGGMRLEMSRQPVEAERPIQIGLPSLGVTVNAVPRWSKPVGDGRSWWCGVEIAPSETTVARRWRDLVDALK